MVASDCVFAITGIAFELAKQQLMKTVRTFLGIGRRCFRGVCCEKSAMGRQRKIMESEAG